MQMRQSDWLSWLEVVYKIAVSSRFSEVSEEDLELILVNCYDFY